MFERAWPLRLVAPLSVEASVKLSFGGNWLLWNFPSYFGKLMQDAAVNWNSQLTLELPVELELPVDLTKIPCYTNMFTNSLN